MIARLVSRVTQALVTWPDAKTWAQCAVASALSLVVIGLVAWSSGMIVWLPRTQDWPLHLLSVIFVPAFTEELVFRGLLIPTQGEGPHATRWIALGLIGFVAWHVIEALTFLPGAQLFLKPAFLLCAGVLGAACAWMRYRTGSLWPAVILHGLTVFVWQVGFGGPGVAELIRP